MFREWRENTELLASLENKGKTGMLEARFGPARARQMRTSALMGELCDPALAICAVGLSGEQPNIDQRIRVNSGP